MQNNVEFYINKIVWLKFMMMTTHSNQATTTILIISEREHNTDSEQDIIKEDEMLADLNQNGNAGAGRVSDRDTSKSDFQNETEAGE